MSSGIFKPANQLEEALVAACTEPSARPEFYRLLLESDLFLLTPDAPEESGKRTLKESEMVSFVDFNGPNGLFLPIFSSQERLQEAVNKMDRVYGFLVLRGKDLFPLLLQHSRPAVLNPGAAYGKELTPDEIRSLADGSVTNHERRVIQKATQVLIGQPAKHPAELVANLQKLFGKYPSVRAAYLGWIHDPASEDPPHLIVGIECEGEMQSITQAAGITSQGLLGSGEFVDFIRVEDGQGSLDSYFKGQTKPFYKATAKKPFWKVW